MEEILMKKKLAAQLALAGTFGLLATLAGGGAAEAAICSGCHTMHNSQDGLPMREDGVSTPAAILLKSDCYGCHAGMNTIANIGVVPPKVIGTAAVTYIGNTAGGADNINLAGGDFYWANLNDARGHNVGIIANAVDDVLGDTPPGGQLGEVGTQLQCAGTNGCHGDRAIADPLASLAGAHHAPHTDLTTSLTGATIGTSFRYLDGVVGREDTNWEFTVSAAEHNLYAGQARSAENTDDTATISSLCAQCHGAYHSTVQPDRGDDFGINEATNFADGNWIRHPTDYDMAVGAAATDQYYYPAYRPETPVGKDIESGTWTDPTVVTANNRVVLCLSCHRAHGAPNDDMLRWSYSLMNTGAGGAAIGQGCFACHSNKD
jgi:hypothetical protein